jgi:DNA-binding PadR family transcriptional regulator
MAAQQEHLTDSEGTLLTLLVKAQPATAYQLSRIYERSPVSNFNTSKGKIYPLIKRLVQRGLIEAARQPGVAKKVELLSCTEAGVEAARNWVKSSRDSHLLLEDPLRTKVQSFDLLSFEERVEWIVEHRNKLRDKLRQVEEYGERVDVPFKDLVHEHAVESLLLRLDWLDRLMTHVVKHNAGLRDSASRTSLSNAS